MPFKGTKQCLKNWPLHSVPQLCRLIGMQALLFKPPCPRIGKINANRSCGGIFLNIHMHYDPWRNGPAICCIWLLRALFSYHWIYACATMLRSVLFRKFLQTSTWLDVGRTICLSPVISPPSIRPPIPTLNYAIPFYIIPTCAILTPTSLTFIIVLTLKLFCIVLPYQYVVIEVHCGPLYHQMVLLLYSRKKSNRPSQA